MRPGGVHESEEAQELHGGEKSAAVERVHSTGRGIYQVAQELDLTETALRRWVRQAEVDEAPEPTQDLTTDERSELQRLRRENRELKKDLDFVERAAAFFAKEIS